MKKKIETIRHGVGNIYHINSKEDSSDGIICMLVSSGVCSDNVFFITLLDGTPIDSGDGGDVEDIHNLTKIEWELLTQNPELFDYISKNLISLQIEGMKVEEDKFKRYKIRRKENRGVNSE